MDLALTTYLDSTKSTLNARYWSHGTAVLNAFSIGTQDDACGYQLLQLLQPPPLLLLLLQRAG